MKRSNLALTLSSILAINSYAATAVVYDKNSTYITIHADQFKTHPLILVQIKDSTNSNHSSTANCSGGNELCQIVFTNFQPTTGINTVQVFDSNTKNLIGERFIQSYAKTGQAKSYYINLNSTLQLITTQLQTAQPPTMSKDFAVRTSGYLKMVSALCPAFKPFADFAGGFFDAIVGQPSGASMQDILDKLSNIENQVNQVADQLAEFKADYDKDQQDIMKEKIDGDADQGSGIYGINKMAIIWNQYLSKGSIDKLLDDNDGIMPDNLGSSLQDAHNLVTYTDYISNDTRLNNLFTIFNRVQNATSTENKKINYVEKRTMYNIHYANYLTKITLSLKQAMEIQKGIIDLISIDSKSKYRKLYINSLKLGIDGINENKTIAQNLAVLKVQYDKKYSAVLKVFSENPPKNIYMDLTTEGLSDSSDLVKTNRETGLDITYFDGYNIRGFYAGESTNVKNWSKTNFEIPFNQWTSTIYLSPSATLAAGNVKSTTGYYLLKDNVQTRFHRYDSMAQATKDTWSDSDKEKLKTKAFNNKIDWQYDLISNIPATELELKKINTFGDLNGYENYKGTIFDTGVNKFSGVDYAQAYIILNKSKHQDGPIVGAIYSLTMKSPADGVPRVYLFGVNLDYDTYLLDGEGKSVSQALSGYRGGLFCVTPNCNNWKEAEVKGEPKGAIIFSDGTIMDMKRQDGIKIWKSNHVTYKMTTRFPKIVGNTFSEPELFGVSWGRTPLVKDGVAVVTNGDHIHQFKFKYKQVVNGVTDYPEVVLKFENNFCSAPYHTKFNKLRTCLKDIGIYQWEVITEQVN